MPSGARHKVAVSVVGAAEGARRALDRPFEYAVLGATLVALALERGTRIADGVLGQVGAGGGVRAIGAAVRRARMLWEPKVKQL